MQQKPIIIGSYMAFRRRCDLLKIHPNQAIRLHDSPIPLAGIKISNRDIYIEDDAADLSHYGDIIKEIAFKKQCEAFGANK
jgi:hypothetical protein